MELNKIEKLTTEYEMISKLKDISKNLSIEVSLASGLAFKEKVRSMNYVIATEILQFFALDLDDFKLNKINSEYYKIDFFDNTLCLRKNNIFAIESEKINKEDFLSQKLIYQHDNKLPNLLSAKEKEKLLTICNEKEKNILNRNYNKQILNSTDYILTLVNEEKELVLEILQQKKFFLLTIKDYLEMIANREYLLEITDTDEYKVKFFKEVFNNYILELGAYIAKEINNYLENK